MNINQKQFYQIQYSLVAADFFPAFVLAQHRYEIIPFVLQWISEVAEELPSCKGRGSLCLHPSRLAKRHGIGSTKHCGLNLTSANLHESWFFPPTTADLQVKITMYLEYNAFTVYRHPEKSGAYVRYYRH